MAVRMPLIMGAGFLIAFVGLKVFDSLLVGLLGGVVILTGLALQWRKKDEEDQWPSS